MTISPMLASPFDETRDYGITKWSTSVKIDGIRCIIQEGYCAKTKSYEKVFSRSAKRIPNHFIRSVLGTLPNGLDGEIAPQGNGINDKDAFQQATSAAMTMAGEPTNWCFYVFDYFAEPGLGKTARLAQAEKLLGTWYSQYPQYAKYVRILSTQLLTIEQAKTTCDEIMEAGGEGLMLADPNGPYVFRRARHTEALLLKLKPFSDSEGIIVGFQEATYTGLTAVLKFEPRFKEFSNLKPKEAKALLASRPILKAEVESYIGKGKGELGSLQVKSTDFNEVFSIGTGFDAKQRKVIWENKEVYLDSVVKFKYVKAGTKDRPRMPVLIGIRASEDMDVTYLQQLQFEAEMAKAVQESNEAVKLISATIVDECYNKMQRLLSKGTKRKATLQKWFEQDADDFEAKCDRHIDWHLTHGFGK